MSAFTKGDAAQSDGQSAELGLTIAKRIVELHGGMIGAQVKGAWVVLWVRIGKEL